MKRRGAKSMNMYVIVGLLAVLFISLAYLSMQAREGFREGADGEEKEKKEEKKEEENKSDTLKVLDALVKPKDGFRGGRQGFRMREGLVPMVCPNGKERNGDGSCPA